MLAHTSRTNRFSGRLARLLTTAGVVLALLFVAAPAFAQQKIGYVDLQRALNEVEEGKKAKARLKQDFAKKQEQLDKKQKEVKALKEQIESGGMMMSQEAKRQKALELQKELAQLQQLYMELQRDLSEKEAKATKGIFDKMRSIIQKIAKEKDYDLVLEKSESAVLYADDSMDLTDELIRRFNKK